MSKLRTSLFEGRPLFNVASYARRGPGRRERLSPAEIAQFARTVRRVPEAVVKVLPRDSNNFTSISRHVQYIGRRGDLELETDEGDRLSGNIGPHLLENWDLELDEQRRQPDLVAGLGRKPSKLVHKLMFSMPPGTPAEGVLGAVRNFLREEFALSHRYAFVLHTDEPHPHVHALVKAVSEQGVRLNIRKATLREWRQGFARHLRKLGIEANATERAVRGECRIQKVDGIYRANRRGVSTHTRGRVEAVAAELLSGDLSTEPGKQGLMQTRREVERGWNAVSDILVNEGRPELASEVRRFAYQMPAAHTENEQIAAVLRGLTRKAQAKQRSTSR